MNMDNGHTLGFCEDISIKYIDVVDRRDAMTMIVCISRNYTSSIKVPLFIFTNKNSNNFIRKLNDSI